MAQRNAKARCSAVKSGKAALCSKHMHGLPFTRKGTRSTSQSWWAVSPTGSWQEDLDKGREYAGAFLPHLKTNGGPPMLAWIFDGMARAANYQGSERRSIDGIASGFLMEIVRFLQRAQLELLVARIALDKPSSSLAKDFKARFNNGAFLHAPSWQMLSIEPPTCRTEPIWSGIAIKGLQQVEWVYWPANNKNGRIRIKRLVVEAHQPIETGIWVEEANVPIDLHQDVARAVMFAQEGLA